MKKILIILIIQIGFLDLIAQDSIKYDLVINGIIGLSDIVPIQDAVVQINNEIQFTNESGRITIKSNSEIIRLKIQHPGFSEIDTVFQTAKLNNQTEISLIADCWVNKELAISDIEGKDIKLLLVGGVVPTFIFGQEKVEAKFKFKYDDLGCIAPPDACIKLYNYEVFEYLDVKYGSIWREQIREDVIGFNEYNTKLK